MTLLGGRFEFGREARIALTGSDFGPAVDGHATPMWQCIQVKSGQVLTVGPTRSGARCYLCVGGGIRVPVVLGSRSTHVLTGFGGHEGRALKKNDKLALGPDSTPAAARPLKVEPRVLDRLYPDGAFRITRGPQVGWFTPESIATLGRSEYVVTEDSNRVGLRLEGPVLARLKGGQLVTEGVALGAVQVPDAGQPIVLLVEQPTTGGYPKIANVIFADLHRLGQLRPRDETRFEWVEMQRAVEALREQAGLIAPQALVPA